MEAKTCYRCKRTKEPTEFNRDKTKPDGLQVYCRDCTRAIWRSRYADVGAKYNRNRREKAAKDAWNARVAAKAEVRR